MIEQGLYCQPGQELSLRLRTNIGHKGEETHVPYVGLFAFMTYVL
ncbi:hypothetical protein GGR92_003001 [Spirosoma lacussanchae]